MKTMKIQGKEYVPVNERVKEFLKLYPNASIETDLVYMQDGVCVTKTFIRDSEGKTLATGLAYEKEGSSNVNRTSYLENCETSSVGRALGFMGIGIDASIASYEEVANAKLNENLDEYNTPEKKNTRIDNKIATFAVLYKKTPEEVKEWLDTQEGDKEKILDEWLKKKRG